MKDCFLNRRSTVHFLRLSIAALLVLLAGYIRTMAAPVDMVLIKSLSEDYETSQEHRKYMVLAGDSLYKIFRKFGIPDSSISTFLKKFMAFNPQVRNIDLILPGQVLLIPTFQDDGGSTISRPPRPPDHPEEEIDPFLADAFAGIGEKIKNRGTFYFPMKGKGALGLDSGRFPMVGLDNGLWLIFDLKRSLPESVRELIQATWPDYHIITPPESSSAGEVLDEALQASRFFSVERRKKLVMGRDIKVSLNCDWLIEKTAESILDGNLYVINHARYPKELIPLPIREYASKYSIKVVNLADSTVDERGSDRLSPVKSEVEMFNHENSEELLDDLLTRLGFHFEKNYQIRFFSGDDLGISLSFIADRYLLCDDQQLALSFEEISKPMKDLLDRLEVRSLSFSLELQPEEIIARTLSALNLRYFGPDIEFFQVGYEGEEKFVINIPGIFTRFKGESILFTGAVPDDYILSFLSSRGVNIIVF